LSAEQVSDIAAAVKAINLINYAPLVEQASKSKSSSRLERYRLRLSGKLDLYCL
jgi:hypothetical protein